MHALILSTLLFCLSVFTPVVLGHGYVQKMVIGGKTYQGPSPYGSSKLDSPIRKVGSTNPITDVQSSDMTCGIRAATTAAIVAPATAGSKLTFTWRQGSGAHWGHSIGPMMTYMAKCPSSGCPGWNPKGADFFKISQTGHKSNSMAWYMADIKAGGDYTTTIPSGIPNGDYIVRHEMIALHFATAPDAAQLFPSCSQVRITGGSSGSINAATAHFPGAYKASDSGIHVPNIYKSKSYNFPGPAVASFTSAKAARSPSDIEAYASWRHRHASNNGTHHPRNGTLSHPQNGTQPTNTTQTQTLTETQTETSSPVPSATTSMILPFNPIKIGAPVDPNDPAHIKVPIAIPMKREGDNGEEEPEEEFEDVFEDEDEGPTFPEDYKRHQARALRRRYPRRLEESAH